MAIIDSTSKEKKKCYSRELFKIDESTRLELVNVYASELQTSYFLPHPIRILEEYAGLVVAYAMIRRQNYSTQLCLQYY